MVEAPAPPPPANHRRDPLLRLARADRKKPLAANRSRRQLVPNLLGDARGDAGAGHGPAFSIGLFPIFPLWITCYGSPVLWISLRP